MKTNDLLLGERNRHIPQGPFNVHPIFVEKAKGAVITDVEGKEYIDFAGGIGVNNVGHCDDEVLKAVQDQIQKYIHTCFHVVMYEPYVELAKKLNQITPGSFPKKTMFANSGAEAVENAVKIARHATGRPAIIAFEDAFHGRTLLALSLTSKMKPYKFGFAPYAPEIYRMPYAYCYRCAFGLEYPSCEIHCAYFLRDFFHTHISSEQVAALIVEPVLGEGGFVVPPKEYFKILHKICQDNGIVFIADEVQTGFGRTAKMFAMEHYEVAPDILLTAKSIAGGFPLSAITGKAELMDHPQVGGLGGTYAGNPVACRAALAVLDQFEKKNLLTRAEQIGKRVLEKFFEFKEIYSVIGDVRGLGAMVGMELVTDQKTKNPATALTKQLVTICRDKGLLMISAGTHSNIIRPLMPLVITEEQLERGLSIIEEGFSELPHP
ncbi:MAG: 4-aminobutyrate--2-oxoglutarate transaminase [Thermodesulfobacteriota bacterium]|nr:4-aminobutyrate--2-oxoglutarate transaminase [Thermodesulfobacteriota bacterium]